MYKEPENPLFKSCDRNYNEDESVNEAVRQIYELYIVEDVCIGELLENLTIPDMSVANVAKVYAQLYKLIEEDKIVRIAEGETIDVAE